MSNLFSGINARFRGTSARTSNSGNRSPTSANSQPLTPTGLHPSSSSPAVSLGAGASTSSLTTTNSASSAGGGGSTATPQAGASSANAGVSNGRVGNGRVGNSGSASVAGGELPAMAALPGSQSTANLSRLPPLPNSPSLAQTIGMDESGSLRSLMPPTADEVLVSYHLPRPLPLWLNPTYAKHIVRGNFMTLSARPKTVEQGEWIAHQIVEHYRNLWNFVRVVHEKEDDGVSVCSAATCPRMSAGANHSFTWLNARREPVELPAYEYMTLMQRWISGKIDDTKIFPTDAGGVSYALSPATLGGGAGGGENGSAGANHGASASNGGGGSSSTNGSTAAAAAASSATAAAAAAAIPPSSSSLSSLTGGSGSSGAGEWIGQRSGFPRNFMDVCQTIFRQMFRVYAHLYWAHFVEPFYHLNLEKQLNSCFSHFVLTATALDMLKPHELEPMQPLIDLWAANGTFPPGSKAYEFANVQVGQRLHQLAGLSV